MFTANGGVEGVAVSIAEDTRLYGYDPMIPPALIQEEIPTVHADWKWSIDSSLPNH